MKKAFIFDMDGVLIDSEPLWKEAGLEVLNRYGLPIAREDLLKMTGLPSNEIVRRSCAMFERDDLDQRVIEQDMLDTAVALIVNRRPLMDGVKETLALLAERGIKMAIASASPRTMLEQIVENCGIAHYFDAISSATELSFNKPHPQVYLHAAELLGCAPFECVGIEDSKVGMTAVKAASMTCIAIPSQQDWQEPQWSLADFKLRCLREIDAALLMKLA